MHGTLLVVDDDPDIRFIVREAAEKDGYEVIEAEDAEAALIQYDAHLPELSVIDVGLPGMDGVELCQALHAKNPKHLALIISGQASPERAVEAMKQGAFDYLGKPLNLEKLMLLVNRGLAAARKDTELDMVNEQRKAIYGFDRLIGSSKQMRTVIDTARKVAGVPHATVLLTGESGTGKELVAHAIHLASPNADKPFVEVNCAAMPENLLEAELFGYEKGAFTDAKQRKYGLFEMATNGTFFLDEIGEMPLNLQVKLLKVIEERTFRRLGGTKPLKVQFRLIAATNANLQAQIEAGKFRRDLYYRLAVFSIQLPALRERLSDAVEIAEHFINHFNREFGKHVKGVSPEAKEMLMAYPWPGNIRELRNAIERTVLIGSDEYIQASDLTVIPQVAAATAKATSSTFDNDVAALTTNEISQFEIKVPSNGVNMEEVERELIRIAMRHCNNNASAAARFLRMTRETLRYRLKKFGLKEGAEK
ncbi:sigma-54 dependent transcriptional regulator [bacterium]|nr:sigma-54 dependent transcriptional regulator [bacterium]